MQRPEISPYCEYLFTITLNTFALISQNLLHYWCKLWTMTHQSYNFSRCHWKIGKCSHIITLPSSYSHYGWMPSNVTFISSWNSGPQRKVAAHVWRVILEALSPDREPGARVCSAGSLLKHGKSKPQRWIWRSNAWEMFGAGWMSQPSNFNVLVQMAGFLLGLQSVCSWCWHI